MRYADRRWEAEAPNVGSGRYRDNIAVRASLAMQARMHA